MLPALPLSRCRLTFRATVNLRLPAYAGSAWRGAFGHALKRLVCVTHEPVCPPCLLYRSCIYPYVFETPPDPGVGKLTQYPAAPHPFVLIPDEHSGRVAAGERLTLDVHLFGHGHRHLPYVIHALNQAGQRGLGQDRGALELLSVAQADGDDWRLVYTPSNAFTPEPATVSDAATPERRWSAGFTRPLPFSSPVFQPAAADFAVDRLSYRHSAGNQFCRTDSSRPRRGAKKRPAELA